MAWSNTAHVTNKLRKQTLQRDSHTCQRCGATGVPLEINHMQNKAQGGTDTLDNLETLCIPCHEPETRQQTIHGQQQRKKRGYMPQEPHPGITQK
ncbi:HNH endonuclease [Corynebacterium stationis]|uniref:HNH endonuclease n=1 Tax=Corynebacterium stationis TaxID=1705 RepID=UPI0028A6E019|nr:HNH endonuclease [Corynebacterium stationis]